MDEKKAVFETLNRLDVSDHTETKDTGSAKLTYLSWPWAWSEVKKRYPDAHYTIIRDPVTHLPYSYDPMTGYMVYTSVTIDGITHEMWLPVMDNNNKAMKSEPYTIQTKYKQITVASATMFDINKSIMRCLVKNLAMFGLGLYIYAGEDLPEADEDEEKPKKTAPAPARKQEPNTGGLRRIGEDLNSVAPAPSAQEPPMFKCEHCGKVLAPYKNTDGKEIPLRAHVEKSKKMFGKVWCIDCINNYLGKGGNETT